MTYKRLTLDKSSEIVLTTKDQEVINLIGNLVQENGQATLTEIYDYVEKQTGRVPHANHIKYCLMILYVKKKVTIKNWRKARQQLFRTTIKLR